MPSKNTRSMKSSSRANARNWIILLVIVALVAVFAIQAKHKADQQSELRILLSATAPPTDSAAQATPLPTHTGSCAYTWAYQDIPSLTEKLTSSLQTFIPDAETLVQAFGEDCVYADGQKVFTPIETDFYVRFHAADLKDEEALGNWIVQIMPRVFRLPKNEIQGNQLGFVEITFIQSDTEKLVVRVPIKQYREEGVGKRGKDLFRLFAVPLSAPT